MTINQIAVVIVEDLEVRIETAHVVTTRVKLILENLHWTSL